MSRLISDSKYHRTDRNLPLRLDFLEPDKFVFLIELFTENVSADELVGELGVKVREETIDYKDMSLYKYLLFLSVYPDGSVSKYLWSEEYGGWGYFNNPNKIETYEIAHYNN